MAQFVNSLGYNIPGLSIRTGLFKQQPVDTASLFGSSVRLNCSAKRKNKLVEWLRTSSLTWDRSIYTSDEPDHVTDDRYAVVKTADGGHDLLIKNLTRDLVGQYSCRLLPDDAITFSRVVALCKLTNFQQSARKNTVIRHSHRSVLRELYYIIMHYV